MACSEEKNRRFTGRLGIILAEEGLISKMERQLS